MKRFLSLIFVFLAISNNASATWMEYTVMLAQQRGLLSNFYGGINACEGGGQLPEAPWAGQGMISGFIEAGVTYCLEKATPAIGIIVQTARAMDGNAHRCFKGWCYRPELGDRKTVSQTPLEKWKLTYEMKDESAPTGYSQRFSHLRTPDCIRTSPDLQSNGRCSSDVKNCSEVNAMMYYQ